MSARFADLLLIGCLSCAPNYRGVMTNALLSDAPRHVKWQLVSTISHDPGSYTEGLVFVGERLFESVGLTGGSALLELAPATGRTILREPWPKCLAQDCRLFAEGLAEAHGKLVQLSWKNQRALTWNTATLAREGVLEYRGDGWGLCYDGQVLWRSDGTHLLHRHDPQTFKEIKPPVAVQLGTRQIKHVNELECAGGLLYANVWFTPLVIQIDPKSGAVVGLLDFRELVRDEDASGRESVLNGIAFHPASKLLYVTGKRWEKIYVVRLAE